MRSTIRTTVPFAHRILSHPLGLDGLLVGVTNHRASSTSRWKLRQGKDTYAREARVSGLKSRAAFKLMEIDDKYRIFKSGYVVVDLGYAPGSWSQVALARTGRKGKVVGIDLIAAQPPRGVTTFQGDFLSPLVRDGVKDFILRSSHWNDIKADDESPTKQFLPIGKTPQQERKDMALAITDPRLVDVVLSDMLMNTSGIAFRDHAGSMDLCAAALQFTIETLKSGGHFICKFYQGPEDKVLEQTLKKFFVRVYREKPESSRSESKEAYFVALRRRRCEILG